jgi:sugar lactone lactonase YvrE
VDAELNLPYGMSLDGNGNVFIPDYSNHRVRMVPVESGTYYTVEMTGGCIYTIAGNGVAAFSGDGGQATSASLNGPAGIAIDSSGNVYISDSNNHRIRKVDTAGIITTFAGDGTAAYRGDGGAATSARLQRPLGISCDAEDNLYIADFSNYRIRMVAALSAEFYGQDMTAGYIYTIAGTGVWGYSGEGGVPTAAQIGPPSGVHVDSAGHLFIADNNNIVRMVPATDGTHYGVGPLTAGMIYTIAGTPSSQGSSGDGGQATSAQLTSPCDMVVNSEGALLIADAGGNRIRKVDADGYISTYAGTGVADYSGDDGPATSARIGNPQGIDVDAAGNTYFSETYTHVIRKVAPADALQTVSLDLEPGWNMVSVPLLLEDGEDTVAAIFDDNIVAIYTWDPGQKSYIVPTTIDHKLGYWVAVVEETQITVTGIPATTWTGTLLTGWNMIGSVYGNAVTATDLDDEPDDVVLDGAIYWWDPGSKSYDAASTLTQSKGYWAATTEGCTLTMTAPSPV